MFIQNEDFFEVIRKSWFDGVRTQDMEDLKPKLEVCKRSLIKWSKKECKNNIIEINKVKMKLKNMESQAMGRSE